MMYRLMILLGPALVVLPAGGRAEQSAEADSVADKQAKIQFEEGVRMFKEGDFDGAAIAFERAFELRPSYKILYNVGQVEAELKHYSRACEAYSKYLEEGGAEIDDARKAEVAAAIERLQALVGSLELRYSKDGVTVLIDGTRRGTTPLAAPIVLNMGTHELSLRDGIKEVYKESFRIAGGQSLTLSLESDASVAVPETGPSPVVEAPTAISEAAVAEKETSPEETTSKAAHSGPKPEKKRKLTWIVGGVGAAAGIAGGIVGGISMGKASALKEKCNTSLCDDSLAGEADTIRRLNLAADMLYGTAGAAAVAAVVLFVVEPKRNKERNVSLAPLAAPAFLGLDGRF